MPAKGEFVWWPERGYGIRTPDAAFPYDEAYYSKQRARENTEVGRLLVRHRAKFVGNTGPSIVDIGIGAGLFTQVCECQGFDVNPLACLWLREKGKWHDIYKESIDTACFWDSLEHILTPEAMLANVRSEAFISTPIYASCEHALRSRHYKPNEHIWYFTEPGLIQWMEKQGFYLLERNCDEERYGREGVGSYRFSRHP